MGLWLFIIKSFRNKKVSWNVLSTLQKTNILRGTTSFYYLNRNPLFTSFNVLLDNGRNPVALTCDRKIRFGWLLAGDIGIGSLLPCSFRQLSKKEFKYQCVLLIALHSVFRCTHNSPTNKECQEKNMFYFQYNYAIKALLTSFRFIPLEPLINTTSFFFK